MRTASHETMNANRIRIVRGAIILSVGAVYRTSSPPRARRPSYQGLDRGCTADDDTKRRNKAYRDQCHTPQRQLTASSRERCSTLPSVWPRQNRGCSGCKCHLGVLLINHENEALPPNQIGLMVPAAGGLTCVRLRTLPSFPLRALSGPSSAILQPLPPCSTSFSRTLSFLHLCSYRY